MNINWAYFRKNCDSCKRAKEILQQQGFAIEEERDAGKYPLPSADIWELIKNCEAVYVTRGKKILRFQPATQKEEVLPLLSGRAGNLRAPTIRIGEHFFVGYNDELYRDCIAGSDASF